MIIDYDLKGCMEGQKLENEITGRSPRKTVADSTKVRSKIALIVKDYRLKVSKEELP